MGVVSGSNLIRFLSVFHITLAYYLLTSPSTIVDQGLVFILGAAMDIVCYILALSLLLFLGSPIAIHALNSPYPFKGVMLTINPSATSVLLLPPLFPRSPRIPLSRPHRAFGPFILESSGGSGLILLEQPGSRPFSIFLYSNGVEFSGEGWGNACAANREAEECRDRKCSGWRGKQCRVYMGVRGDVVVVLGEWTWIGGTGVGGECC